MKTLVVAEKPSVGRDIARVLKATGAGNGCLVGENYVVTWAVGHLVTLMEPDEVDTKYKKWSMANMPILPEKIPLKVIDGTKDQYEKVRALMNSPEISDLICATDSGREGELIFRYIYTMAECKKPFRRLWISSMTDEAIRNGFATLKPSSEYEGLYASARCRSEADWLVGMNATRAFTLRYDRLLSAGRVQTPTLALIVARDKEISAFVAKPYWQVTADFGAYKGVWFDKDTKDNKIPSEEAAKAIANRVKGKTGVITRCETTQKREGPEKLYDLTTLQREANRKYGYKADKTLEIAQALYEKHKLLTYPRTDSRYLPDDMEGKVAKTLSMLPEPYKSLVEPISPIKKATRVYDNEKISDHHALIPTDKYPNLNSLTTEERNIYDMVTRRLIANHYPDYVYNACVIETDVMEDRFKTNCNTPVSMGWKVVYKDDEKDKKGKKDEDTTEIPDVSEGQSYPVKSVSSKKSETKPPAAYTDDTLLKAMEDAGKTIDDEELREKMKDSGLGTPATRAAIINRIVSVGYVERKGKNLISTEKGQKFIAIAPAEMTSAVTTGKWERALAKMATFNDVGTLNEKQTKFMDSIRRYSAFLVSYAGGTAPNMRFPEEERFKGKKK